MNLLNPAERAAWMRAGMLLKAAQLGLPAETIAPLAKQADLKDLTAMVSQPIDIGAKTILYGSLITGIPVGIMAHMISKKMNTVKAKQRILDEKIRYYQGAAEGLETGMAQSGVTA
jgi:hypothetical protein